MKTNIIFLKAFFTTLLWKQNGYHRHGVVLHTFRVLYYTFQNRDFRMIPAALFHDIGKPVVAYQKDEDIPLGEYSFTDHEEKSYEIIKDWRIVGDYTKTIVRYHYLIRDRYKHKTKDPIRYTEKTKIWNSLTPEIQNDLKRFLKYDDLGKGKRNDK